MNLGIAFQIQDDLLDIISDKKILGKQPGSDLSQGKKTYPLILLEQKVNNTEKKKLIKIMKKIKIEKDDMAFTINILNKYGIIDYTKVEIKKRIRRATGYLNNFDNRAENLFKLSEMIAERKY